MAMAVDCLASYLYTCKKGERPEASPCSKIVPEEVAKELDFEYEEAFVNLVTVDVEEYARKHFARSVKKTLTIPAWMNEAAMTLGVNFSQVLQEALLEKIQAK